MIYCIDCTASVSDPVYLLVLEADLHLEYLSTHANVHVDKHYSVGVGGVCDDERSGPLPEVNAVRDLRRHCVAHLCAGERKSSEGANYYCRACISAHTHTISISAAGPVTS